MDERAGENCSECQVAQNGPFLDELLEHLRGASHLKARYEIRVPAIGQVLRKAVGTPSRLCAVSPSGQVSRFLMLTRSLTRSSDLATCRADPHQRESLRGEPGSLESALHPTA